MPWHIASDNPDCDGFAVVKDDDGSVAGCHTSEDAAQAQLAALYASETRSEEIALPDADIQVRDKAKRELDLRIMPWNSRIATVSGLEEFERGAFAGTDPGQVLLMGLEHEVRLGIGQDGSVVPVRRPMGRGLSLEERPDAAYMTVKVANTAAGDEIIALAEDGIARGVSIEFTEVPGGSVTETRNGRRVKIHRRVTLNALSTTYRPAYAEAGVLAIRTAEGEGQMAETPEAAVAAEPITVDMTPVNTALSAFEARMSSILDERIGAMAEQARASFTIPAPTPEPDPRARRGDWLSAVIRQLSGERVSDSEMRVLADLVTADNLGVVPDAFLSEVIGVIDPTRPFLGSTRRLDLPPAGMSITVPKIVTRPTADVQAKFGDESYPEKSDVASTATSITNVTFDAITIAGGGDISLQLLKRSSPSYLSLFLELLAEAYGQNAEAEALASLLDTVGDADGVNDGGVLDPENLVIGPAWASGAAVHKPINTMWLSSNAVSSFIDAKASTTNAPLYSQIQAGFTAGAGPAGTISGLRPIYVPELDNTSYDVLVGPSSGFGWTEDGTYTLQVDVPAKAGRDVALVGILWFAPMYPTAFTAYGIAGS